jgi:hypothetical protein
MLITDPAIIDATQAWLNKVADDREISRGIELGRQGYQKLARVLTKKFGKGFSIADATDAVHAVIGRLRDDDDIMESYQSMFEDDRYGYEPDALNNVTIRDTVTGRKEFLRGSEAEELLSAIKSGIGNEQEIIAGYFAHNIHEDENQEDTSFDDEINSKVGIYNFPWTIGNRHGTASADYSGSKSPDGMKIRQVRDENGEQLEVGPKIDAEIRRQAIEFIGDA